MALCKALDTNPSSYYAWQGRPESKHTLENAELIEKIKIIHEKNRQTYGTPRIKVELQELGDQVSRHRIGYLMKKNDLYVLYKRKFRQTTQSKHKRPVCENVLNRQFEAEKPNQKWSTDITYLPTKEGWLYLAVIMDLFSRKVVGWAFDTSLHTNLVMAALQMAEKTRNPETGLLHHSDRGSQYASEIYQQALDRLAAVKSMSRKGNCWDNAVLESFFSTLKTELDLGEARLDRQQTKNEVFEWIEVFYNRQRRHSSLGYLSPAQFENIHSD